MYRMLIVDDEPVIVDGMADLFKQVSDMDLEIYIAYSGDEALECLNRIMVDIVLSDIRMPGISGLELLDHIRGQWPHCKVIFLTAHNDSEYIRTALRCGGADYLLKTESEEAIVNSVRNALEYAAVERRNLQVLEKAKAQLKIAEPMLRRELLLGICDGTILLQGEKLELAREVNLPLDFHKPVLLLIGRIDRWKEGMTPSDKVMLRYAIENITQELLSLCILQAVSVDDSRLVWFIQPAGIQIEGEITEKDWEKTIRFVHGTLETVQTVCRELLQIPVSFAAGRQSVPWSHAHSAYESLRSLIGRGLGLGKETLLIEGRELQKSADRFGEHKQYVRHLLNRMSDFETWLENGHKEPYLNLLHEMETNMLSLSGEAVFFQEIYYSVSIRLLAQINEWDKEAEISGQGIPVEKLANIHLHADPEEAFQYLTRVADALFHVMENEQNEKTNLVVSMINSYIEEHIEQELSLTTLARVVHLNANYLSRLYKQITGIGITDYITNFRIMRARHLLQHSFHRVHEISRNVGFENPAYFARVFRKQTGVSPQEYRESVKK